MRGFTSVGAEEDDDDDDAASEPLGPAFIVRVHRIILKFTRKRA